MSLVLLTGMMLPVFAEDYSFVGNRKCKGCHLKEWTSWSQTRMARAFDVLKPGERADAKRKAGLDPGKDYTKDKDCLPCHVTGYGRPGGFTSVDSTPDMAGVGCEMCHGAGSTYTGDGYMTLKNRQFKRADLVKVGLVVEVTESQCRNCHNSTSPFVGDDYVFDFGERKTEGTHEKFPAKYPH